jgi:hypothetical protein
VQVRSFWKKKNASTNLERREYLQCSQRNIFVKVVGSKCVEAFMVPKNKELFTPKNKELLLVKLINDQEVFGKIFLQK